jgi:hypothetical protein
MRKETKTESDKEQTQQQDDVRERDEWDMKKWNQQRDGWGKQRGVITHETKYIRII